MIVDQSDDSREVLRTILQQQGVRIMEADAGSAGLKIARDQRPDVIVLDIDAPEFHRAPAAGDRNICEEYADQANADQTSLVIIGTSRRDSTRAGGQFIRKPYQYGPLIRKIEALLAESGTVRDAA